MSAINCPTEVYEFSMETAASLKKTLFGLSEAAQAALNACENAEAVKKRCGEVRDGVVNMTGTAKERLITIENLLLSEEEEDKKRYEITKEKLTEFLKSAERALEILNGAFAYLNKAVEEIEEYKRTFWENAEGFGREADYGLKRLIEIAEAVKRYEALPKLGENI